MSADGTAGHANQAQVKDCSSRSLPEDSGQSLSRADRFKAGDNHVVARVHAAHGHGDNDQRGNQSEGQEHGHGQVPFGQLAVGLPPTLLQQRVGVQESHVDTHGRAEHSQHLHDGGHVQGSVCQIEIGNAVVSNEAFEDFRPGDVTELRHHDDAEHNHDQGDTSAEEPFVDPHAFRIAAVIKGGDDVDQQDRDAHDDADGQAGAGEAQFHHRVGGFLGCHRDGHISQVVGQVASGRRRESVLWEVPNYRRHDRADNPEEDDDLAERSHLATEGRDRPFALGQHDVAQRSQHHDAQEHRHRLHPEKFVTERGTGQHRGRGAAGPQGHGTLQQTGPRTFDIAKRTLKKGLRVERVQFSDFLRHS